MLFRKVKYNNSIKYNNSSNIDVSQKSATERKKLLDSGEIETSVELKFEEAKSVSQLWEALHNYDAVYSHLHPKVLVRIMVHWHSFANLGTRQVSFFRETFDK